MNANQKPERLTLAKAVREKFKHGKLLGKLGRRAARLAIWENAAKKR